MNNNGRKSPVNGTLNHTPFKEEAAAVLSAYLPRPQDGADEDSMPAFKRSEETPWTGCPGVFAKRANSGRLIC